MNEFLLPTDTIYLRVYPAIVCDLIHLSIP